MRDATETAFLQAIIAEPDDDVHRLVFADWLQENGQEERAEFVRVQIELAALQNPSPRLLRGSLNVKSSWKHALDDEKEVDREVWLRRRERELLEKFSGHRDGDKSFSNLAWWSMQAVGFAFKHHPWEQVKFRRGFVHSVSCSFEDWIGQSCDNVVPPATICPVCHGLGRVNAHGPAVCATQPIQQVTFTDKKPDATAIGFYWITLPDVRDSAFTGHSSVLPHFLRLFLPHTVPDTESAAIDALSGAAIAWARQHRPRSQ